MLKAVDRFEEEARERTRLGAPVVLVVVGAYAGGFEHPAAACPGGSGGAVYTTKRIGLPASSTPR